MDYRATFDVLFYLNEIMDLYSQVPNCRGGGSNKEGGLAFS